jgi:hypothetical protein
MFLFIVCSNFAIANSSRLRDSESEEQRAKSFMEVEVEMEGFERAWAEME